MHLTLRQLQYFVAIVDAGTMTSAAAKLSIAPTALSQQIKKMEENFGVSLLKRHSRGIQPTNAGGDLYRRASAILHSVTEAEQRIAANETLSRPIRFGLPPSTLRIIGLKTLVRARQRFPGVKVSLCESYAHTLTSRLRDGDLDFAIASEFMPMDGFEAVDLFHENLVFVTEPAQARPGKVITLAEALDANLMFIREGTPIWCAIHAAARRSKLTVNVSQTVESLDLLRQMVRSGVGSAILPFGAVAEESDRGDLAMHRITSPPVQRRMTLAWYGDNDVPIGCTSKFVDMVRDIVSGFEKRGFSHMHIEHS